MSTQEEQYRRHIQEEMAHKRGLIEALISRPLTEGELIEIGHMGSDLLVVPNQPYRRSEIDSRFQSMLLIQQLLRAARADKQGVA